MPIVPMIIRVFVGLVILAAALADSCLRAATQEIAPLQRPSDAHPDFTPVDGIQPFTSADALAAYNRANGLARKGDHAAARRQYDEAIELEPGNRSSLLGRCIAFRHLHDYEHAMRNCEEAIRLAPNSAAVYRERGVTRLVKADHDGAVADFTEAIRLFPKYSQALNDRATARTEFKSAALRRLSAALTISPAPLRPAGQIDPGPSGEDDGMMPRPRDVGSSVFLRRCVLGTVDIGAR